jgi:hypothetical protein
MTVYGVYQTRGGNVYAVRGNADHATHRVALPHLDGAPSTALARLNDLSREDLDGLTVYLRDKERFPIPPNTGGQDWNLYPRLLCTLIDTSENSEPKGANNADRNSQ